MTEGEGGGAWAGLLLGPGDCQNRNTMILVRHAAQDFE